MVSPFWKRGYRIIRDGISTHFRSQLEQGYLNIKTLVAMDSRLDELNWLYKLWEKRGLVLYNGLLYKLTSAGEFWTVNITQSTLEAME